MHLFITGTDTGVGKTHMAAALIRTARQAGIDAVGWKPICCGDRDDAEALWEAGARRAELNDVNPVWFRTPAAPYTASLVENRLVDLALLREGGRRLSARHALVIAEGAGGMGGADRGGVSLQRSRGRAWLAGTPRRGQSPRCAESRPPHGARH